MAAPQLPRDRLTIWTIYENPSDYPGKWVLRAHHVIHGSDKAGRVSVTAERQAYVCDSLEQARACIPFGLIRLPPDPNDDPVIKEVWI